MTHGPINLRFTVHRVQSPSRTARDRRPAIFSIRHAAHPFSKLKLAETALMSDEEEKIAARSDKKKLLWVHKCLRNRKLEFEHWTVYR